MRTLATLATLLVGAIATWSTDTNATSTLSQTFNDPTPTAQDRFGNSVAIWGNYILIGAHEDDTNAVDGGQAHLFVATTGNLLQTFTDPTPNASDTFGNSVAISGNNVLIGTRHLDQDGTNVGQAYLYDAATGNLLHTFTDPIPSGAPNLIHTFGNSVAISGNNVLIGTSSNEIGYAHLFDVVTGNLLLTFTDPTPALGDLFGFSVALEGSNVLVGARNGDNNNTFGGQAHLFDATTGNLLQTFIDPTPNSTDLFGSSVAISGNNILIGTPSDDSNGTNIGQAHLFDAVTGNLVRTFNDPTPTSEDTFGTSVAIFGNNALIGAISDDTNGTDAGQVHLFDATTGLLLQTFDAPTISAGDLFGASVAIDGNNVMIGAIFNDTNGADVGQAYLFTLVPDPLVNDTCDIGGGSNDIKAVLASYDDDTDEIVVTMVLCAHADSKTRYRVSFDHQDTTNDGPDTLDPNPHCRNTFDDSMTHKGMNDRGVGMINVVGNILTFRVAIDELNPNLGADDTVLISTASRLKNVTDQAPNVEAGDGCDRPEVASEVISLELN